MTNSIFCPQRGSWRLWGDVSLPSGLVRAPKRRLLIWGIPGLRKGTPTLHPLFQIPQRFETFRTGPRPDKNWLPNRGPGTEP